MKATVEEVNGRVPVLAGTGFNPPIAVELARQAAAAGVSGILAFPPYYTSQDDEGITAYYRAIADATPLGLLIYSRDWFNPSPSPSWEKLWPRQFRSSSPGRTARPTFAAIR